MKLNIRQKILGSILGLTIVASIYSEFDDRNPVEVVESINTSRKIQNAPETHQDLNVLSMPPTKQKRWNASEIEVNIFPALIEKKQVTQNIDANLTLQVKPVLVPTAPPLPFTYLGKMIDGNSVNIFVSINGKNHTLKAGETIEGIYLVKSIEEKQVIFEYTPLKEEQILTIRGSS